MSTKYCKSCDSDLPATEEYFARRYDRPGNPFQSKCRKCQKAYRKAHYEANKQKYIDKAKDYRDELLDWFKDYRKSLVCEKCGETRWYVLDFHHKDPKEKEGTIIDLIYKTSSKRKILEELSKCSVLCANCHREEHYTSANGV